MFRSASQFCVFQSTPPVKAATSFPAKLRLSTIFQSTPPVKAATCAPVTAAVTPLFQSTPPVKAATIMTGYTLAAEKFQSTPPVKAATCAPVTAAVTPLFQSTPPVKAATVRVLPVPPRGAISIHAAREGGDWGWHMTLTLKNNFNPRRP